MNESKIFIITGEQGEGKTTKLTQVIDILKKKNYKVSGFIAPGRWSDGLRSGFDIVDIKTDEKRLLCQSGHNERYVKIGRFNFDAEAIKFGEQLLLNAADMETDFVVIDEIGMFELQGKLWAGSFLKLVKSAPCPILITVRSKFIEDVKTSFKLSNHTTFHLDQQATTIAIRIVKSTLR